MKRVEITMKGEAGDTLSESGFVEDCSELPMTIMHAVEDYLEAHGGSLDLPLVIRVQPSSSSATC